MSSGLRGLPLEAMGDGILAMTKTTRGWVDDGKN
jgi:hypothetical protein